VEPLWCQAPLAAPGLWPVRFAKIKHCRVIGTAGGKEKCDRLTHVAGFDGAIDYKSEDNGAQLLRCVPTGLMSFDNVGGIVFNEVLARINLKARIMLCGAISRYNETVLPPAPSNYFNLTPKRARTEGFIIVDYVSRLPRLSRPLVDCSSNANWCKRMMSLSVLRMRRAP
jgi:NADPH-dependent curcumin reductase CurA